MAKTDVKKFTITAQEKISQWQNTTYVVEATSEAEARQIIRNNPQEHCISVDEELTDTEEVITVDFGTNYTCEEEA